MVKYLFDDVERSGSARPPCAQHRRGGFVGKRIAARIECPVHKGQQAGAGMGEIDRRAEDKAVRVPGLPDKPVDRIVKHTAAGFPALAAPGAVGQRFVADEERFGFHPFLVQRPGNLGQRRVGAAVFAGTAVDQKNFHAKNPPLRSGGICFTMSLYKPVVTTGQWLFEKKL